MPCNLIHVSGKLSPSLCPSPFPLPLPLPLIATSSTPTSALASSEQVLHVGGSLDSASTRVASFLAQRLWGSDERFDGEGVPEAHKRDLCSLLNDALRNDDPALLAAAMPLIRAINCCCIVRGSPRHGTIRFPQRGLLLSRRRAARRSPWVFAPGVKYRVPGILSTSFHSEARSFPIIVA